MNQAQLPAQAGIHSIDHFALIVPDLDEAERFYSAFGLRVTRNRDVLHLRAAGSDHVWGRILPGESKRLAYISLNCKPEEFVELSRRIAYARTPTTQPHERHMHHGGVWLLDPDGNLLQVRPGAKTSPDVKAPPAPLPHATAHRGATGRRQAMKVEPTRLSHVLLFATSIDHQLDFYRDVLGLGLSDRSRDGIAFMHGLQGSDHHLMAFGKSARRGFHHVAWNVPTIEDIGLGWMQMQQAGYARVWGPGRHVLGSNYFCYVEDPWGSFCEYSADIDHVDAGSRWPSGDHDPEDSLYLWGPPIPGNFLDNTDAER